MHVTLRIDRRRPELRVHRVYRAVHRALRGMRGLPTFRVVHVSIQNTHLHLLVEADDRVALSRGMQGLAIRLQRQINGPIGTLFTHRYHAVQICSPRQARCALAYVLNNWRRHHLDIDHRGRVLPAKLDEMSSAISFTGWRGHRFRIPATYDPLPVTEARTWLLVAGWRAFGLIDPFEVPGPLR